MADNQPSALSRLWIKIKGVAARTVSRVNDLIADLTSTGVKNEVIKERIKQELQTGATLAEMRNFATAQCPGFVGDMVFRFARDTLADKQKYVAEVDKRIREKEIDARDRKIITATGEEKTRIETIQDAYKKQGIDITAYTEELPEPPPDAPLSDKYMWVAVEDKATCDTCAGNHGKINTLGDWSSIGEPRSGACFGEQNCRCILVPVSALSAKEQQGIINSGPLNIPKPKKKK